MRGRYTNSLKPNRGSLGGTEVFIINSEQSTRTGVRADILGLAETGHTVILELKQADGGRKGSRTALVQALEYAADFRSESYRALSEKFAAYANSDTPLDVAHADYFNLDEPLSESTFTMATDPRIVLLAEHFEPSDIDAARYLRDAKDVDITCTEVTAYDVEANRVYAFECRLQSKTAQNVLSVVQV